ERVQPSLQTLILLTQFSNVIELRGNGTRGLEIRFEISLFPGQQVSPFTTLGIGDQGLELVCRIDCLLPSFHSVSRINQTLNALIRRDASDDQSQNGRAKHKPNLSSN